MRSLVKYDGRYAVRSSQERLLSMYVMAGSSVKTGARTDTAGWTTAGAQMNQLTCFRFGLMVLVVARPLPRSVCG